jgi:acyl carrier protein phosphodiesterase
MNYLAHLFLSGTNPEIMIGNLMEDYIKGNIEHPRNNFLSPTMKIGVRLHREIDSLMDSHPTVKKCKELFYENFGKYSPIIMDVLFDHFLLINWDLYTSETFENFRIRTYKTLQQFKEYQPQPMILTIESMVKHDWLKNYEFDWGLERAFINLNTKINQNHVDLRESMPIFKKNYNFINQNFNDFFVEMKNHCDNFLEKY